MRTSVKKVIAPIGVLLLGGLGAAVLVWARDEIEPSQPPQAVRVVRAVTVERGPLVHEVRTFGTVMPRKETRMVAEVTGRITAASDDFVNGGFVEAGELLLEIDRSIYAANVSTAEAALARAEAARIREEAEAKLARSEWEKFGEGEASPLVLRVPQLAEAKAAVASARAVLERAEIDLGRTRVVAPYRARIRQRFVEEGQYVTAGSPVAVVFSVESAEVRLPITVDEVAYLDLPLGGPVGDASPAVTLNASFGGRDVSWPARIVRTEGEMEARTRTLYAVARVMEPYRPDNGLPPLLIGTFVEARVTGRAVADAAVIPRVAVDGSAVWVVTDDDRLTRREVQVLRLGRDDAWIGSGLAAGERVCVSDLDLAVEGMAVRLAAPPAGRP